MRDVSSAACGWGSRDHRPHSVYASSVQSEQRAQALQSELDTVTENALSEMRRFNKEKFEATRDTLRHMVHSHINKLQQVPPPPASCFRRGRGGIEI